MCAPKEGMKDIEKGFFCLENLNTFLMFKCIHSGIQLENKQDEQKRKQDGK